MNTRVTTVSIAAQSLRAATQHTSRAAKYQEQITTGRRINRPSDDPLEVGALLAHRSDDLRLDSLNHNIQSAQTTLNSSVARLIEAKDLVVQAKSIALSGSSEFERDLLSDQVDQIFEQMVRIGNSELGGDFIFSGTAITTSPIATDSNGDVIYEGSAGRQSVVVGRSVTVDTSYSGEEIFFDGDKSIFQALRELRDALLDTSATNGQIQEAMDESIGELDRYSNHFLDVVGEQASTLETLEAMEIRNEDLQLELQRVISEIEGADIAEAVVQLQTEQNLLQYTFATTARMFDFSLLNYI